MQAFVETLVRALIGGSDGWEIKERLGVGPTVVLEIRVAERDLSRVVGTGGSHMAALRTLVQAAQRKDASRYVLELTTLEHS